MFRPIFGSHLPAARPHIVPPPRRQRVLAHRSLVCSFLLTLLLLLSQVLGNWGFLVKPAEAASLGVRPSAPASMTLQQFLKDGHNDRVYRGPVQPPPGPASMPKSTSAHTTDYAHLPPSAEPPTMSPLSHGLDASLFASSTTAGSAPLDLVSSDKRLEVRIVPGSLDLSQATVAGGGKPSGSLTLTLTELHGHFAATMNMLGAYQLQITDAQGHLVHGLRARTPVSFIYHYQPAELTNLDLDPGRLSLSWPSLIQAARQARQPTTGFVFPMRDDPVSQTLTAPSTILGSGILAAGVGDPQNQSPPTPHFASEQGNSGQLAYAYPLQVSPGTGGFAPTLMLNYSSGNPNGRPSRFSPANNVGDGWTLSLGSITVDTYPDGSQWYFISGIDNVGDRLIANGSLYDTEHLSRLRIQQGTGAGGQPCFHVWDKASTYYELGCTADSLQYRTDSTGTRHNYRWDVNKIVAPNQGPASAYFKLILVSYEQDQTTSGSYTTIRDAAIKQILYGTGAGTTSSVTTVAGTVDFAYHAPSADAPWATAYGTNYNCGPTPPVTNTTLRCDDPIQYGTIQPPAVMSTLTLDTVTSYVGADSSSSNKAYGYSFTYTNTPFATNSTGGSPGGPCYDPVTLTEQYCASEHLLSTITPTVYQNGTAHQFKQVTFGYSGPMSDSYYDSGDKNQGGTAYGAQTYWQYLTSYLDTNTGVGGTITYSTAYNNTHGTPSVKNSSGSITDDRYDALFCTIHANDSYSCSGTYAHPDDHAWSQQVVTSITSSGKDSSASNLSPAKTTYSYYRLAKTGTGCPADQFGLETDCVGDNWLPKGDTDWQDFFHGEFRGFAQVWTLSAANDLTVDSYYSTEGWNTPSTDGANYNAGQLYETDSYTGSGSTVLSKTQTVFAGMSDWNSSATSSSCRSSQATYVACEVVVVKSRTLQFEGSSTSPPWVEHDETYDDYTNTGSGDGLSTSSTVYHNLTQEVTSGSNLPTASPKVYPLTEKVSYTTDDRTTTSPSWTYYTVDTATHSELDDANGHVWQCQYTTYDEGTGNTNPDAGWPTTVQTYNSSNCAGHDPTKTLTTTYQDYDVYGHVVATVDAAAAATPPLYNTQGCSVASGTIVASSSGWTKSTYTSCTAYNSTYNFALPVSTTNAFGKTTTFSYDTTQGDVLTSTTDPNTQATSYAYSYGTGTATTQVSEPGETNSYTTRSTFSSSCTTSSTLPCFEIDTNSFQYSGAIKRTFYDSLGRAVETRTPGPGASYDTIVFTVYNDQTHTSLQSVPFQVASGSGWVDPNGAVDYQGVVPGGTATFYDALGRAIATQDPQINTGSDGIACSATLTGTYTACANYSLGTAQGDSNTYLSATMVDPNKHVSVAYADVLGRTVYTQQDSGTYGGTLALVQQTASVYNALDKSTSLTVTDKAPQSGQSVTSVQTTEQYDDLGRITQLVDPDRGTHNYTYDANGNLIQDSSGTRTIGYAYDLLNRLGCVQDQPSQFSTAGSCGTSSNGGNSNPYVQNTYDTSKLTISGTTDYPVGRLTQSISTTYFSGSAASVTESYEHDARGRSSGEQLQFSLPSSWNVTNGLPTYQAQYLYNDADQPTTTQTNPGGQGFTTTLAYDSTGALSGLSNNTSATPNLATLVYNARAQLDTLNFQTSSGGALAAEQFGYDANLRTTSASATWGANSGNPSGSAIFSQGLSYDPASNLISLTSTQNAAGNGTGGRETSNFCYDEQNRLVWAGNSGTQPAAGNGTCGSGTLASGLAGANYSNSYVYTHLGQLWQGPLPGGSTQEQYLYCASNTHQLVGLYPTTSGATCSNYSTKTADYSIGSYDGFGNVASRTANSTIGTLTYDILDHLTQWSAGSNNQEQYLYDASGERMLRRFTNNNGTTILTYPFGIEEHQYSGTGSNQWNIYYYFLAGRSLGSLDGNGTQFYLTDAQGSLVSAFTNAQGGASMKSNQLFGPYGNVRYYAGNLNTAKGFLGQYNDGSGLDYFHARYYDPVVGVFMSADTVQGNLQAMNPYTYVNGNPETHSDPSGRMFITEGGGGGGLSVSPPPAPQQSSCNFFCGLWNGVKNVASWGAQKVENFVTGDSLLVSAERTALNSTWHRFTDWLGSQVHNAQQAFMRWKKWQDSACIQALSFTPQTKVATAKGSQAIVSLHVGEKVWAYNPKTHKMELQPILHVWINHDNDLVDLTVTYLVPAHAGKPVQQKSEVIHTNRKHPFLIAGKGFMTVANIRVGMHLVSSNGSLGIIQAWKAIPGIQAMYNLTVAQDHTYTVGAGQWIVHNDNCAYVAALAGGGFDPRGIQGSSLNDILDRLPPSARSTSFYPSRTIQQGYKWTWQEGGHDYELEVHGPDSGAPPGSAASQGWVARVWRQVTGDATTREYAGNNGNWYAARGMSSAEQTLTHIEIEDPGIAPPTGLPEDPPFGTFDFDFFF